MKRIAGLVCIAAVLFMAGACGSAGSERPSTPSPAAAVVQTDTTQGCLYALVEEASTGVYVTEGTVLPECDGLTEDERMQLGRLLVSAVHNLSEESNG